MKIEVFETDPGYYTAIVDSEFADGLTKDEALGVVASALFSSRPIFVRSYEEWVRWHEQFAGMKRETVPLLCSS